jgi:hypothetical protein
MEPDIAEVIGLHREFPAWAVWLPHDRRQWIAARPASSRAPGPDLPMIWAQATSATALADQMRAADAQLRAASVPRPPRDDARHDARVDGD